MMSEIQMPHDDMASQQSLGGHTDTCDEQFVGAIETDFTNAGQNYSSDGCVPVPDAVDTQCPVDEYLEEKMPSDERVRFAALYVM